MKAYAIALLGIALSGCVMPTKQPSPDMISSVPADRQLQFTTKTDSSGSLVVTRDVGFVGSGCHIGVLVDGELAAKFEPGERTTLHVPAGEHVLTVTWVGGRGLCSFHDKQSSVARRRSLEATIAAGAEKNYRIHTDTESDPTIELAY